MKFSIKDFFIKCDQIRRKLRIWPHLLTKSLMETLFFVQWSLIIFTKKPDHRGLTGSSCHHIETSQLICSVNQLTGFYTMATLAFNELTDMLLTHTNHKHRKSQYPLCKSKYNTINISACFWTCWKFGFKTWAWDFRLTLHWK